MGDALDNLENSYARLAQARRAFFIAGAAMGGGACGSAPSASLYLLGCVRPGDRVVVDERFRADAPDLHGADVRCADALVPESFEEASQGSAFEGRLFWLVRAVGGSGVRVAPLRDLGAAARRAGAVLIVDNTLLGVYGCTPLAMDAHICVECLELEGDHFDVDGLCGTCTVVTVARSQGRGKRVDKLAELTNGLLADVASGVVAPAVSTYPHRGGDFAGGQERDGVGVAPEGPVAGHAGAALSARYVAFDAIPDDRKSQLLDSLERAVDGIAAISQRRFDNARAIAEYLAANEMCARVSYPGLASHPDHALAASVLQHGFGPMVEFEPASGIRAADFVRALPERLRNSAPPIRKTTICVAESNPAAESSNIEFADKALDAAASSARAAAGSASDNGLTPADIALDSAASGACAAAVLAADTTLAPASAACGASTAPNRVRITVGADGPLDVVDAIDRALRSLVVRSRTSTR